MVTVVLVEMVVVVRRRIAGVAPGVWAAPARVAACARAAGWADSIMITAAAKIAPPRIVVIRIVLILPVSLILKSSPKKPAKIFDATGLQVKGFRSADPFNPSGRP
jgi:hypothetical protein